MASSSKLGDLVKKLRGKKNWTQEKLAGEAGIGIRTLQRIENGKTQRNQREVLDSLAKALEVDIKELIEASISDEPNESVVKPVILVEAEEGKTNQESIPPSELPPRLFTPPYFPRLKKRQVLIAALIAILAVIIVIAAILKTLSLPRLQAAPASTISLMPLPKVFKQAIPYCSGRNGWSVPPNMQEGTPALICSKAGLQLEQDSPQASHYAEIDLEDANNVSYNQGIFRVKVSAILTQDDPYTYACLIVQTPAGSPGGYILCVNDRGSWQLQDATNITNSPGLSLPTGTVNTSPGKKLVLLIQVQGGILYCSINGQSMQSVKENLQHISQSGMVGLIVEKTGATTSAPVIYSDFELDTH